MSRKELDDVINRISRNLSDLADVLLKEEPRPEKKRKDPNAPKQPASSFFIFTNSIREEIDKAYPNASFSEKSKLYGSRWQQLTEEEKKPYVELAKKERERYQKDVALYEQKQHEPDTKKPKLEEVTKAEMVTESPAIDELESSSE
ncbi:high mobility group box domain-containing protein, partial [Choanephora cucurbitarum]